MSLQDARLPRLADKLAAKAQEVEVPEEAPKPKKVTKKKK